MLLRKTFPADIRVAKEARALRAAGHEVVLVCREYGDRPARETINGIEVVRANPRDQSPPQRQRASFRYLATSVHPFWRAVLDEVVREDGIDAIHVHDLPMVHTGCSVGEVHDLPVVADLHENYPEAIRQWRRMDDLEDTITTPSKLAEYALRPVRRWKRIERSSLDRADRVLAVCEEARAHYERDCGLPSGKVAEISNTVDLDTFDALCDEPANTFPNHPFAAHGFDDAFVITYVGKFAPHRGLETVIRALPALHAHGVNPHLLLVGKPGIEAYGERLASLCHDLGVDGQITVTGWVDFERVPGYVAASDVCVVTHAATPHTNTTIPHKLFQYMAAATPVLVSDVPPLRRVVTDSEAGRVIPAGDHEAAADALRDLADDPERAARLGANGRRAVEAQYHWGRDGERLRALYHDLDSTTGESASSRRATARAARPLVSGDATTDDADRSERHVPPGRT